MSPHPEFYCLFRPFKLFKLQLWSILCPDHRGSVPSGLVIYDRAVSAYRCPGLHIGVLPTTAVRETLPAYRPPIQSLLYRVLC